MSSIVPVLLNEFLDNFHPSHPSINKEIHDQNFGIGLTDVLHHPPSMVHPHAVHHVPFYSGYIRPWRQNSVEDSGVATLIDDKTQFKVNLDVHQFMPKELKVTVDDGYIVVEGKHAEKLDEHGIISRRFVRKYKVPDDVDPDQLVSKLSSDGVLSLQAPKMIKDQVREIPITHTHKPMRIKHKGHSHSSEKLATN